MTEPNANPIRQILGVFRYAGRALSLVWTTSRRMTILLAVLTLVAGLVPAAIAVVGKLIVDAVVLAADSGLDEHTWNAIMWVGVEAGLVVGRNAAQRGLSMCKSLLRALLGQRVNVLILEKAGTLHLEHFEDSEFYDKLTRARREASSRPLSLVIGTFGLVQNGISLVTYAGLLLSFSPWAAAIVVLAGLPAFFVEAKFSGDAFRLFRWRSPETRKQWYLETVLAREDHAKEVKLFGLGPLLLGRYRDIFKMIYADDRSLTLRRGIWGYLLGLLSTAAFYGAYAWIALATVAKTITLGDMTMYLLLFKQGQSAVAAILSTIGDMYEDNLYLSTLYEFLELEVVGEGEGHAAGPDPQAGIKFEDVTFVYPGASEPAVREVNLRLSPGDKLALVGQNGAGKTTLIKLLTRLYRPTSGRILLDGLDLRDWDGPALRERIGVIFQDFSRYQMLVGENIGAGDVAHFTDEDQWHAAAERGMADEVIATMPLGYSTQLGRWFKDGQELSGGEWQKIALSRLFMRGDADILVLDEPTASMDAEAEAKIFDRFRSMTDTQMAILISHRFSTVRMAEQIVVLEHGRVVEEGDHDELMRQDGTYARLFTLQAAGYR